MDTFIAVLGLIKVLVLATVLGVPLHDLLGVLTVIGAIIRFLSR